MRNFIVFWYFIFLKQNNLFHTPPPPHSHGWQTILLLKFFFFSPSVTLKYYRPFLTTLTFVMYHFQIYYFPRIFIITIFLVFSTYHFPSTVVSALWTYKSINFNFMTFIHQTKSSNLKYHTYLLTTMIYVQYRNFALYN